MSFSTPLYGSALIVHVLFVPLLQLFEEFETFLYFKGYMATLKATDAITNRTLHDCVHPGSLIFAATAIHIINI